MYCLNPKAEKNECIEATSVFFVKTIHVSFICVPTLLQALKCYWPVNGQRDQSGKIQSRKMRVASMP